MRPGLVGGKLATRLDEWCPCINNPESAALGCPCALERSKHCTGWEGRCTCTLLENRSVLRRALLAFAAQKYEEVLYVCTGTHTECELPLLTQMVMYGGPWESFQCVRTKSAELAFLHLSLSNSCNGGCGDDKCTNVEAYFWVPVAKWALLGKLSSATPLLECVMPLWRTLAMSYERAKEHLPKHFLCVALRAAVFHCVEHEDPYLFEQLQRRSEWIEALSRARQDMNSMVHALNRKTGTELSAVPIGYRPVKYSVRSSNRFHLASSHAQAESAQRSLVDRNGPSPCTVLLAFCSGCKVLKFKETSIGFPKSAWDQSTQTLWCTSPKCQKPVSFISTFRRIIRYRDVTLGPCERCGRLTYYELGSIDSEGLYACTACLKTWGKNKQEQECFGCKRMFKSTTRVLVLDNDRPPDLLMRRVHICKRCLSKRDVTTTKTLARQATLLQIDSLL